MLHAAFFFCVVFIFSALSVYGKKDIEIFKIPIYFITLMCYRNDVLEKRHYFYERSKQIR